MSTDIIMYVFENLLKTAHSMLLLTLLDYLGSAVELKRQIDVLTSLAVFWLLQTNSLVQRVLIRFLVPIMPWGGTQST